MFKSMMVFRAVETHSAYLSTLRAQRFRTVIPTEAFWRNGTSLQRYNPNGLSLKGNLDARS